MSNLSNAEKQRLLRERRQAKLKALGGARLNKITSSNSSFASTTPSKNSTINSATAKPSEKENDVVPDVAVPKVQPAGSRSNRISSIIDNPPSFVGLSQAELKQSENVIGEDPEIADIDHVELQNIQSSIFNAPANGNNFSSEFNQDDFFKNLLGNSGNGTDPQQDIFSQLLNNPNLAGLMNDNAAGANASQPDVAYNTFKSNKFKAWFLLFRVFFLTLLMGYCTVNYNVKLTFGDVKTFDFAYDTSIFYKLFLTLELVFLSIFLFYLNNIDYQYQYDSLIPQSILSMGGMFVPLKLLKALQAFNRYYQVFKFFSLDVSYVVFLLVLFSFF